MPLRIMRAITRAVAWRDGAFADLQKHDRAMLVEVLRCVSKQSPTEPAFVRRDTLAVRLDCSLATVTRLLARLEELGWILRHQVKSRETGFQVGSIALTAQAVSWLGFDAPSPQSDRCSPMSDASIVSNNQSLQRQPAQAQASLEKPEPRKTKPPAVPGSLPSTLSWLASHMSRFAVFKLMKLARGKKLLLEDLVSQCKTQIESARNCFAYVRSLLEVDKDWSWLAKAKAQEDARQESRHQEAKRREERSAALQGAMFLGKDGLIRRIEGMFVRVFDQEESTKAVGRSRGAFPLQDAFFEAIDRGELAAWPG